MGIPIQLIDLDVPFAWQVPGLLDEAGCADILFRTHDLPWLAGTVNGRDGRTVRPELRDADVCFWRDPELASSLLERFRPALPPTMRGDPLVAIRSSIRIYRYDPGQFFAPHRDQKYREDGLVSHLALLVYLDQVEEGGATWFPEVLEPDGTQLRAVPQPGLAVLFQNATLHAGEAVVRGRKHVLRADVMYRELSRT